MRGGGHYVGVPIVIKASGLALGKGAYVCFTVPQALDALHAIMVKGVHADAGNEVVIEEYLPGPEFSLHAFCDGKTSSLFPPARDHKSIFNNDRGPNTGGMGVIAPIPDISHTQWAESQEIVTKTLDALRGSGAAFVGCLYPGLKMSPDGLRVLEFNARFGDPETQVYMRLLKSDILPIFEACIDGNLDQIKVEWYSDYGVCVILASEGYPSPDYKKGVPITGIKEAESIPGVTVYHAGTVMEDGVLRTSGGRVLGVTATGGTLEDAIARVYAGVDCIKFEGMHYRTDIGRNS